MPKKLINLSKPQLEWLEAEAQRLGITVTELVRRIIDRARGAQ